MKKWLLTSLVLFSSVCETAGLRDLTPLKGNVWNPASKSGLIYWFRATDGITKDGSNNVSQWNDLTANAYNATASGNHQPTWTANSQGGKPCISFDGASGATNQDFMEFATGVDLFADGSARAFFGTIKSIAKTSTWYNVLTTNRTATTNKNFAIVSSNDSTFGNFWFGSFLNSKGIQSASADVTTSVVNLRINYNGGTVTSTGSWTASIANSSQSLTATTSSGNPTGNHNYIGEWTPVGGTLSWKGLICELGAYNSEFTSGEGTLMNTYQTGYWVN